MTVDEAARFAHVIEVREGLVVALEQITDSARWWAAAGPDAA
jgi:ketosteroid isomerase-like protein